MKPRVLIVEDDLAQKPLWETILKRQLKDFEIDWTVNFEEAKKLWNLSIDKSSLYKLVIADIFLSGSETGIDFASLKKQIPNAVPFVIVTSLDEEDIRGAYPELLQDTVILTKPLKILNCTRILRRLMSIGGHKVDDLGEVIL